MKKASLDAPYLKALLYGAPGSTKTRTAASACLDDRLGPVMMLESAGNPISIRDYLPRPTILTMEALNDYGTPYDFFSSGQPANHPFRDALAKAGFDVPEKYNTLVVDGMTEVQRFAFRAILPGYDTEPNKIPAGIELQHFNRVLATMVNWAYKFIRLDMHVILTSLEDEKMDKMNNVFRRPLLWGQSRGEISSYVYLVMRLTQAENMDAKSRAVIASDVEEAKHASFVGFTRATASFYAKDQYGMKNKSGELMRYMYDPTISKIWDAILAANPNT